MCEECSADVVGKETRVIAVQSKHTEVRKAHVKFINIVAAARKTLSTKSVVQTEMVPSQGFLGAVPPCDTGVGIYSHLGIYTQQFSLITQG